MGKIDDYYIAIVEKIDKNIRELAAIKNYDELRKEWTVIYGNYLELLRDYRISADAVKRLNTENEQISNMLLNLAEESTKELAMQDAEIWKLKQALGFRQAATTSSQRRLQAGNNNTTEQTSQPRDD